MIASIEKANEVIKQQDLQIKELTKKIHSYQINLNMLQDQVDQLLRRVYGRRSEKLDPNQLMFDNLLIDAIEQPDTPIEPLAELPPVSQPGKKRSHKTKRKHPGRLPIPAHLERKEIILDIPVLIDRWFEKCGIEREMAGLDGIY